MPDKKTQRRKELRLTGELHKNQHPEAPLAPPAKGGNNRLLFLTFLAELREKMFLVFK